MWKKFVILQTLLLIFVFILHDINKRIWISNTYVRHIEMSDKNQFCKRNYSLVTKPITATSHKCYYFGLNNICSKKGDEMLNNIQASEKQS